LAKKVAELVCSSEFAEVAHTYTSVLELYVRDDSMNRWSTDKRMLRTATLDAARAALGHSVDTA
jgi:hypothetical protein